jgi:hypothetical protein
MKRRRHTPAQIVHKLVVAVASRFIMEAPER